MIGQRVQVRTQLVEAEDGIDRCAVTDQMQRVALDVHDPIAGGILYPGLGHVPFPWHLPIEHGRAGGDLGHFEGNALSQRRQCSPHAIAGDTPADRVEILHQTPRRPGKR